MLFKLRTVGISCIVTHIIIGFSSETFFLKNIGFLNSKVQRIEVVGVRSGDDSVVLGVPLCSVLGPFYR